MEIETALRNYLLAQNSITTTAGVGQRIYFEHADQSVAKPYIVIERTSDPGEHTSDGPVAMGSQSVIIGCYGTTWTSARDVAAAVKAALDGLTGIIGGAGGLTLNPVFYENQDSGYDADVGLYYVDQEYLCQVEG